MNMENARSYLFEKLTLIVTATLLVCATGVIAQTERVAPEPIPPQTSPLYPAECPRQEILAGVDDDFSLANGVEIAAPSATLQTTVGGPFATFDGTATNVRLAHTFRLPPCKCLVGAKLEFRAKALGSSSSFSSGNDTLTLGFSTLWGFPHWEVRLGGPAASPALSTPNWGDPLVTRTFSLDLATLSTSTSTISLLSAMQTNKYLDFVVQDDTSIDYIKLSLTMCDCCQPNGRAEICISKFFDQNRDGVKDASEPGLPGWTFQANDQAGGNLVTSPPTTSQGGICFSVLAPATYNISEVPKPGLPGWIQTLPVNPPNYAVTVSPGGPVVNLLFGNWRKSPPSGDPPDELNHPN